MGFWFDLTRFKYCLLWNKLMIDGMYNVYAIYDWCLWWWWWVWMMMNLKVLIHYNIRWAFKFDHFHYKMINVLKMNIGHAWVIFFLWNFVVICGHQSNWTMKKMYPKIPPSQAFFYDFTIGGMKKPVFILECVFVYELFTFDVCLFDQIFIYNRIPTQQNWTKTT